MRNDHFFPAKVSPKSQKSSKKAYFVKICCPKGAGGLLHSPRVDPQTRSYPERVYAQTLAQQDSALLTLDLLSTKEVIDG